MGSKEYEKILDAIPNTGIYVIREDNHEILYFNKRIKKMAPNVKKGMTCDRLWKNSCSNCPLLNIGDKQESQSPPLCENILKHIYYPRKKATSRYPKVRHNPMQNSIRP